MTEIDVTWTDPPKTDTGYVAKLATNDDVEALREKLLAHPGCWVSFRSDFSLKLDHDYSNHITPKAIYGTPTEWIACLAEAYLTRKQGKKDTLFHRIGLTRRPTAVLFETSGRVVSNETYREFAEDYNRLHAYVSEHYPEHIESLDKWTPTRVRSPDLQALALFYMSEAVTNDIVGALEIGNSGIYHHPSKPKVWRELMCAMNIDAFEDRQRMFTGDYSAEIAVFCPKTLKIVDAFENPAAAFPVPKATDNADLPLPPRI